MTNISSTLQETRRFKPDPSFAQQANLGPQLYQALKEEAAQDYEAYWARLARKELVWRKDFQTTLEWEAPFAKWFQEGELNMAEQCLDRHLNTATKHKAAIIWEGEPRLLSARTRFWKWA
jgi:acetyl-CoA synthetase